MNSKVRFVLLFVALFVIASSTLFAQTRAVTNADISASLTNPGPDGPNHAIIGTIVNVVLTDPDFGTLDEVTAPTVASFAQFGAPSQITMTHNGAGVWTASYTVTPGTSSAGNALVNQPAFVSVFPTVGGSQQNVADDEIFNVHNVYPDITGLLGTIDVSVLDPGPVGQAKIGSTIEVSFEDAGLDGAIADFANFGGGLIPMTQTGDEYFASYDVVAGNKDGDFPIVLTVQEPGNPNSLTLNTDDVTINNIAADLAGMGIVWNVANPGVFGEAKVGSVITAEIADIGIASATADFTPFGGGIETMTLSAGWYSATYTVVGGNINGSYPVEFEVFLTGNPNPGTAATGNIDINNVVPDYSGLVIDTNVVNPGNNGIAIVGSTIEVSFDDATVDYATADFTAFGGGMVAMVQTGTVWTASYDVVAGTVDGSYPIEITLLAIGNSNAVTVDSDDVDIDNVLPTLADMNDAYLQVITSASRAISVMRVGDSIQIVAEFEPHITQARVRWDDAFAGGTAVDYDVVGGQLIDAIYTPAEGSLVYSPGVEIRISRMWTESGNNAPFASNWVTTNADGDPVVASLTLPQLTANDLDLYFDNDPNTGWLRFSPNSPEVVGFDDSPDHMNIMLHLENWGALGDIAGLQLRFEAERSVFYREYEITSPELSAVGGDIIIQWDGKNDLDEFLNTGTYGITLWKVWDIVGNTIELGPHYYIADEYPPAAPLLDGSGDPQVVLNRMHVVVDNDPMVFARDLNPEGPFEYVREVHTNHFIGDIVFPDQTTDNWTTSPNITSFNFQARRDFLVDTNPMRREWGYHWTILSEDNGDTWIWNTTLAQWDPYVVFDPSMISELTFATDTAQNSAIEYFSWNAEDFQPPYTTIEGDYERNFEITSYLQDNAGNIAVSSTVELTTKLLVTETTYEANLAVIEGVEIISEHDGGTYSLPAYDGFGDHIFYLSAAPYYPASLDEIDIRVTINDPDYLKAGNSVALDLSQLGLGIMYKTPEDFDASNQAVFTISNADLNGLTAAEVGQWIIGTAGPNNLPISAVSSIIDPTLDPIDITTVSTFVDIFNLEIPPAPVYPTQGTVTALSNVISPGHAAWTYNAEVNPANDNILDETVITINVPAASFELEWWLTAENAGGDIWSKNGTLAPNVALVDQDYPFHGLSNDLQALMPPMGEGEIDVELLVVATQFADDGYLAVEDQATYTTLTIDNVNPRIVETVGYTYDHATRTAAFDTTPVVSMVGNSFEVVLKTNEPLRTDNLNVVGNSLVVDPGWSAVIVDENGDPIQVGMDILSASVVDVEDLGDNEYRVLIEIVDLNSPVELLNQVVVLRLPWDEGGNPGRVNNPSYPTNEDLFYQDSSEVAFNVHILNARPWISKLEFINYESQGEVEFDEAGNPSNEILGYINNDNTSSGTLIAWIDGGINRAVVTNFAADVTAISGMVDAAALAPTSVVMEAGLWKATWDITDILDDTMMAHGDLKEICVSAVSTEMASVYHSTTRSIEIEVDNGTDNPDGLPVIVESSFDGMNNTVDAGATNGFSFVVEDADSGIWWDPASITLTFTEGITHNNDLVYDQVLGVVSGSMDIPVSTDVAHFVATFTVKDNVNNTSSVDLNINVLPAPVPSNVVLISESLLAPDYFQPGTDVTVEFDVSDANRADMIEVKIFDHTLGTQVGATHVINDPTALNYSVDFASVMIPDTHELRADVIVSYSQYDDSLAGLSTLTHDASSNNNLIADGTDPDGLPVIVAEATDLSLVEEATTPLTFEMTDSGSGINWASADLVITPSTDITIAAPVVVGDDITWDVTLDDGILAQRLVADIYVEDNVGNSYSITRYLNVMPVPEITNILITDLSPDNVDPTNWFVPHHNLEVSFNVSDPQRVEELTVTIEADGAFFMQSFQSFSVGQIQENMSVVFNNVFSFNLDGKVIKATVTGHTKSYSDADLGTESTTPLIGSGDFDEINVDTKPVILSAQFYMDDALNVPTEFLLSDLNQVNDLRLEVVVQSPNDIIVPVITLPAAQGMFTYSLISGPIIDGAGVDRELTYVYSIDSLDLEYDEDDLYSIADFEINTNTIYGYHADSYDHSVVVLGAPEFDQYGVVAADRSFESVGRAPMGWFAPEHELITEYHFVSFFNAADSGIEADFDRITDNIPENWDPPTTINTVATDIALTNGRVVTLYSHHAIWESTPDNASVWNAYDDGEAVQIDYRFNIAPLTTYIDFSMVRVDKEVPTYEKSYYDIAVAYGADAPVYETISSVNPGEFREINLALDPPAPGEWENDKHVYLRLQANDGAGVGTGWITAPVAAGWTVVEHDEIVVGNTLYKEWKLSPNGAVTDSDQLVIQLSEIEDLTGHKNYAGVDNIPIHSNLYTAVAPTITIGFTAGMDDGIAQNIIAYQKLADELDPFTSPYLMPGMNLGFQIELISTPDRSAEVAEIVPILVQINDPTETDDNNANWHNLAMIDPSNPYAWYLDDDLALNPDPAVNSLGMKYRVTYEIRYEDNSTETRTFTSSWFNTDTEGNPLILIDRTAPQFVVDGVVLRSESSVTDNYIVPGEEINITVLFTDESDYYDEDTKPGVLISNLDSFLDGVGPLYAVDNDDISYDEAEGQWVAYVSGLMATMNPNTISEIIDITLSDPVGHTTTANKFVEIANHGPIVPIIRDVKYLTQIYDGSFREAVVEALDSQSITSKIEVYIDTEYEQYIDEVWIDAHPNITVPAEYTIREAVAPEAGRWVAVFENVVATDLVAGDIDLVANTKRIPYSAEIFEHSKSFTTPVDMMDFMADTPVVTTETIESPAVVINDLISPEGDIVISVDIADIGEDFALDLPADISGWITLESDPAGLFSAGAPVITANHTAEWVIDSADLADLGITDASITIEYQNIYGQVRTISKDINIDSEAPVLANMELYLDGALLSTGAGSLYWDENWNRIRLNFADMPAVNVGVHEVTVSFDAHPLTYQFDPSEYPQAADAINTMQIAPLVVNPDGSGYVDITFSGSYSGTTLANGRYLISVMGLTDRFGASVDLGNLPFDFDYDPAEMTFYIDGIANNNTVNVSDNPVNIIANTSSTVAGLEGVEFRLYYDADNDGVLSAADVEITHHLDPAIDLQFPYDALWLMDADEYKFVDELAYDGDDYRGFILRASAIVQTRDLYDYTQLIQVYDDVAPVPQPDLTLISHVFDYQSHVNIANIPVDFVDRDVVSVTVDIYDETGVLVETIVEPINDPSLQALVAWDFDTYAPGTYSTKVMAEDFIGNSHEVDGPMIEIINAISMAEAEIKIFNRIATNNELEITGQDFADNPIADYLIIEASITNPSTPANPLNGIASVSLYGEVIDVPTGAVIDIFDPLMNDDATQPHQFVNGEIESHLIYVDQATNTAIVRLVLNSADITGYMADDMDHRFQFKAVFHPEGGFAGIDMPEEKRPFSWFTVDKLAPAMIVNNVSTSDPVSWVTGHQASFEIEAMDPGYDTDLEIVDIELQWSIDGIDWTQVRPLPAFNATTGVYEVEDWRIRGGNQYRYIGDDYEGPVMIRVQTEDKVGNVSYNDLAVDVMVDNNPPVTVFTHVSQDISYPVTEALTGDYISIINDQTAISELRLYVDAAVIEADAVLPLMMRQLRPNALGWEVAEYAWTVNDDNMYEFVIPTAKLENGEHRFAVLMQDELGNLEGDTNSLTHAYDGALSDAELENATDLVVMVGPKIVFNQVGNAAVVSEIHSMAQDRDDFTGLARAGLASTLNVASVGFEYSETGVDPWTPIDVALPVIGSNNVSVAFTMPALRAPILYLRATAYDALDQVMSSGFVQLYEDTTAPIVNVVAHVDEYEGKLAIDPTEDMQIDLTYSFDDLEDVEFVRFRFFDNADNLALARTFTYTELGEAENTFFIPENGLANLLDGVYRLDVTVRDFAGNIYRLSEDAGYAGDYDVLHKDTSDPQILAVVSTSHMDHVAPYDVDAINFRVSYDDVIGFGAQGALTATFAHQNAIDVVDTYTVDEANSWIEFSWNPSADFEQFIVEGELNIMVDIDISATDLLGHNTQMAMADFFTLTYGVANVTKLMVVSDYYVDLNTNPQSYVAQQHLVNWNLPIPQIPVAVGTSQSSATPKPLDLYAYVAHQADMPDRVAFHYEDPTNPGTWVLIDANANVEAWQFVNPGFLQQFQSEYHSEWNIQGLPAGTYKIKTTSHYYNTEDPADGTSESIVEITIQNADLIPNFVVDGSINDQVERGSTYYLSPEANNPFIGDAANAAGVVYKYRFVDADNNYSPTSVWQYFGDANGVFEDAWIQAGDAFTYQWNVYPYYLFNNHIQIVAFAIDQWGTETQIADALTTAQIVEIINTQAPEVAAISTDWTAIEDIEIESENAEDFVSVEALILTGSVPEDLVMVEFYHQFSHEADFVLWDSQDGFTPAQMANNLIVTAADLPIPTDTMVSSVALKVVTTDVYGNTNEAVRIHNIPAAQMIVTHEGVILTSELERESFVMLEAETLHASAGNVNVAYQWAEAANIPVWNPVPFEQDGSWQIPADWTFGATYLVKATVNEEISGIEENVFSVVRDFIITDHTTSIQIDDVAGIIPSSTDIIDGRLHGDIPVTVTVNDPAIPRVEYVIRESSATDWTSLKFVDVVATDASTIFVDGEFDAMASGEYHLGVRPAAMRNDYPVVAHFVTIVVDNDFAITLNGFVPETDAFFNGENFIVEFTVDTDDEINEANVVLEYNTDFEPTWNQAAVATLATADGISYTATFANVAVPVDGYYNFRLLVQDSAVPAPNMEAADLAENVLVDTGDPVVAMVSINGETDLTLPIDIELGTQAEFVASAYDVVGGQIHLVASGIASVNILSGGEVIGEAIVEERSRGLYTFVWNTTGFEINQNLQIQAVALDNAGNEAVTAAFDVNIVAPQEFQAYGIITAMDFDSETANNDVLYAVVKDWPNTGVADLTFEYFNGNAWSQFAVGIDQGGYFTANFNAELMTDAQALRAVVNGNHNAHMPELAVQYVALGATLQPVAPAISAEIFYENELRITENFHATPIVTALQGGAVAMSNPYPMNGNQVVDITIDQAGTHSFWAAVLDDDGDIQLTLTELTTTNAGIASDNGITLPVPAGGFVYFQNVDPAMPLSTGFTALSDQHAVFAKNNANVLQNSNLTIDLTAAPAAEGQLAAMFYDEAAGAWSAPMAVIDNEDGSVTVNGMPTGHIVSVVQYTGVGINAMFESIDPVYVASADMWTTDNTQIKFFVHEGLEADGYVIPQAVDSVVLYLNDVPVNPAPIFDPATGLVEFNAIDLPAGMHTARLVVTQQGFVASAEQDFHVDTTVPVITASGSQIDADSRTITATIIDAETGIMDVQLVLDMNMANNVVVPMDNFTVAGNVYSYQITDEDLFTLGYNFSNTMELTAVWSAENNLEMPAIDRGVNYTVNLVGPGIVFTGFDDGWWINPTQTTPLTFDVIAPAGREIQDNLMIDIEELINDPVNGNYTNLIQQMEINPISVSGNVYSYSVNFGYPVAPNAHAIRLAVFAEDNYGVTAFSEQTYGLDYLAPILWAISPVGDPINPDEFPVTYESAVLPYGNNVTIGVGFQDMQGFALQETGEWVYVPADDTWHHDYLVYYTGASGMDLTSVEVTLNGDVITGALTEGTFIHNAGMLDPGQYTVIATAKDKTGNLGSMSYSFTITGGAPTIAFDPIDGDWWINSTQTNELGFTVESQNALASGGVVANIYAEPSNIVIQGPITPSPSGNSYNISLLGGIVPGGSIAVRLEVTATDIYGGVSTSNQSYGIDNNAPQISLLTPAENAQFALNHTVNITASITDQFGAKSAGRANLRSADVSKAGSGIATVSLKVVAPDGSLALDYVEDGNIQAIAESVVAEQFGSYSIILKAIDAAGNQSIVSREFSVVTGSGPAVSFNDIPNGWLNSTGVNQLAFTIDSPVETTVIANVYTNPSEALLMGPLTVNPVGGVYTVAVNGSMIPADQTSIRLMITATDIFGNETVANYYYNVDKVAPRISFLSPEPSAEITYVDETTKVIIEAQFSDIMPGAKSASGSGIASSRLVVIDPAGMQVGVPVETAMGVTETLHEVDNLSLGTYTVRLTVWDNAGNQAMETVNFTVVAIPEVPASLEIAEARMYPNPMQGDSGARFSVSVNNPANLSVRVYDFAGREVRNLDYAGRVDAKSAIEIVFDGRNNDGTRLARGTYFARVTANDGKKIVEKVVKIAIR